MKRKKFTVLLMSVYFVCLLNIWKTVHKVHEKGGDTLGNSSGYHVHSDINGQSVHVSSQIHVSTVISNMTLQDPNTHFKTELDRTSRYVLETNLQYWRSVDNTSVKFYYFSAYGDVRKLHVLRIVGSLRASLKDHINCCFYTSKSPVSNIPEVRAEYSLIPEGKELRYVEYNSNLRMIENVIVFF
ncbi:unnamed protein product [Mytilus coruscus]|uniref:Uncharacterized protein n=1 Tax=Mytilus coruscus TaxID=42192 RepID=A0A6J8CPY9_MYTCO|nr:unnamed protein product [Mytilus coruscus]